NPSNAVRLIDIAVKLDYLPKFPFEQVRELKKQMADNFLAYVVLRQLTINYLYMYHTEFEEKQQIGSLMDIKIEEQMLIDATSKEKKKKK
ncbi:MAG TPA: hypothetical protein PLC65_17760, partial [Bacteroidia bacterium]|nr:hypothetical protein [Bacteroidia bacterium]